MVLTRLHKHLTSWPYRYRSALDEGYSVGLHTRQSGAIDLVYESARPPIAQSDLKTKKFRPLSRLQLVAFALLIVLLSAALALVLQNPQLIKLGPPDDLNNPRSLSSVETRNLLSRPSSDGVSDRESPCDSGPALREQLHKFVSISDGANGSRPLTSEIRSITDFSGWSIIDRVTIGEFSNYVVKTPCIESALWQVTALEGADELSIVKANPATVFERRG